MKFRNGTEHSKYDYDTMSWHLEVFLQKYEKNSQPATDHTKMGNSMRFSQTHCEVQ